LYSIRIGTPCDCLADRALYVVSPSHRVCSRVCSPMSYVVRQCAFAIWMFCAL